MERIEKKQRGKRSPKKKWSTCSTALSQKQLMKLVTWQQLRAFRLETWRRLAEVQTSERIQVVGARRAGQSVSETADLQTFSPQTISRVHREQRKYPVSGSRVGEVRGQTGWRWWKGSSSSNNHSLQPQSAEHHLRLNKSLEAENHTGFHFLS